MLPICMHTHIHIHIHTYTHIYNIYTHMGGADINGADYIFDEGSVRGIFQDSGKITLEGVLAWSKTHENN